MELLAPAGSESALIAAVQSGADAVYMGGSKFSARHSAKNFSNDDMKRWIDYCHIRGVDVHVAANILIKEKEVNEFIEYIGYLNEIGVDAVIIQDIGMASLVRRIYPDLTLHASTQMTAASSDAVNFLNRKGFQRVVLSRELSRNEIEEICKVPKMEIEVFVHGALCMCYSGQCLMSSIIGGRSGNRGMCAQPCRLPYGLVSENKIINSGYLLSPKDLAMLDEVSELKKMGVASLKIEGRLKRPEYVAAIVKTYRKVIDFAGKGDLNDWNQITDAFNRSGFTKGYYTSDKGKGMMSYKNPGNIAENKFSEDVVKLCRPDANERKIGVDIYAVVKEGKAAEITLTDTDFNSVSVVGEVKAEKANNRPLDKERLISQLTKLGNTPFKAINTEVVLDEGIVLPVSEINSLRRKAIGEIEKLRCKVSEKRVINISDKECKVRTLNKKILSCEVYTKAQAKAVADSEINIIYAPEALAEYIKKTVPDKTVITVLPPVWRNEKRKFKAVDGVLVSNFGQLEFFDENCYGGFRLNIYNNNSIDFYKNMKSIEVSPELNVNEIRQLTQTVPLEIMVYGRLPLMVMENCPLKANGLCGKKAVLKDRRKEEFPFACAPGCYSELLNSKPLFMADKAKDLLSLPVSIFKLKFTDESEQQTKDIIKKYVDAFINGITVEGMKENTFTRGHYYRGVE